MRYGFLAGCFDPFVHPGMILGMRQAVEIDQVCDTIIVALHEDPSRERPAKSPPFLTLEERRIMLEAIKYVGEIINYKIELDLLRIIEETMPDVRLLGEDYRNREDWTGKTFCEENDIPVYFMKRYEGWSCTKFRERIVSRREG